MMGIAILCHFMWIFQGFNIQDSYPRFRQYPRFRHFSRRISYCIGFLGNVVRRLRCTSAFETRIASGGASARALAVHDCRLPQSQHPAKGHTHGPAALLVPNHDELYHRRYWAAAEQSSASETLDLWLVSRTFTLARHFFSTENGACANVDVLD